MYQLEIILSGTALLLSIYIILNNVIRRFRFNLNKTLALIAFLSAVEFSIILMHLLHIELVPLIWKGRIFIALILYIMQLLFHLIHIYPNKEVMPILWFFLITGTPGFAFMLFTIFTDMVIKDVTIDGTVIFHVGKFFPVYIILIAFYLIAITYVVIQKFRESATRALSQDLIYFISGFNISFIFMLILTFILPTFFSIMDFRIIGICVSGILILLILNYGIFDYSALNFKKFYFNISSWIVIFLVLLTPVYLIIVYKSSILPDDTTAVAGVSVIIFIFQFFFLGFLKRKADELYNLDYNNLSDVLAGFIQFSGEITASDDLSMYWDSLYNNAINSFESRFGILSASLFIYNNEEERFSHVYGYGETKITDEITKNSAIVKSLYLLPGVTEESMLHSNLIFAEYKDSSLAFINQYDIKIVMPFLNDDNDIFALLFLGSQPRNRIYSRTFLSVLENFRQKFQHQLLNGLILEEIRTTQINEHDRMVINAIKKRIIPEKLKQIKGLKISSFNINNSMYGGDYYDTVIIDNNKLCIFISDTSYSGIDSSIIALEEYSTLHSQISEQIKPHHIMNSMNWVISTSDFDKKQAPAYCMTITSDGEIEYCNAAYNPPVIYNTDENSFSELPSDGIPVGTDRDYIYESKKIRVKSGNIVLIHSDGISTAINQEGDNYSIGHVKDVIRDNSSDSPPVLVRKIYQDLTSFVSGMKQNNDISLILFRLD